MKRLEILLVMVITWTGFSAQETQYGLFDTIFPYDQSIIHDNIVGLQGGAGRFYGNESVLVTSNPWTDSITSQGSFLNVGNCHFFTRNSSNEWEFKGQILGDTAIKPGADFKFTPMAHYNNRFLFQGNYGNPNPNASYYLYEFDGVDWNFIDSISRPHNLSNDFGQYNVPAMNKNTIGIHWTDSIYIYTIDTIANSINLSQKFHATVVINTDASAVMNDSSLIFGSGWISRDDIAQQNNFISGAGGLICYRLSSTGTWQFTQLITAPDRHGAQAFGSHQMKIKGNLLVLKFNY